MLHRGRAWSIAHVNVYILQGPLFCKGLSINDINPERVGNKCEVLVVGEYCNYRDFYLPNISTSCFMHMWYVQSSGEHSSV